MSSVEPRFTDDVKPSDKDIEGAAPPSYPINEPGDLVIGHSGSRWRLWLTRRNHGCAHGNGSARPCVRKAIIRGLKFLVAGWLLLNLVHLVSFGIKAHKTYKSINCLPITPSEHVNGFSVTVPIPRAKHIFVHNSLSGGDSHIVHDPNVAKGTVEVGVTFANPSEQTAVYDGCAAMIKRAAVFGIIPRNGTERAKVSSFTIRLPESPKLPNVVFLPRKHKGITDKTLQKIIKIWRKHSGKGKNLHVEGTAGNHVGCDS